MAKYKRSKEEKEVIKAFNRLEEKEKDLERVRKLKDGLLDSLIKKVNENEKN